jgi:hypothetical protein
MSMLVPAVRNLAKPNSKRLATAGIAIAITLLVYVNYARGLQALVDAGNRQRDREWMKASVKAFLREPQARLSGSIPYPDVRRFLTFLTDANVQKILPPEIRQPALSSSWSATGDAWTPNGTHTPTNPEASWGSWSGSDAHTGRIESPTFTVIEPYLKIPISGYPALPGNELAIETTGGPTARIVYTGGNPGERWNTWTPDVSSIASRNVRIIGMDNNTTLQSWFGIGQPQAATRTQITIDGFMSYLDYVAGIAIIGAVVALGLPIVAERHEVHPPPPETPAPGETKRRRSKA